MTTESPPLGALPPNAFGPRLQTFELPPEDTPTRSREARLHETPSVIVADADAFAATLLDDRVSSPARNALRLLTGAVGTMLLQAATDLSFPHQSLHDRLVGPPGLALSAAATLVIGLPGTLILLTALGSPPSFQKAYHALLRAYSQVGLLAGGFAPGVALFALTGGGLDLVSALSFLAYAVAGTVSLFGLARRVVASAGDLRFKSFLAGAGFLTFTLAMGVFLWVKLMGAIVR
jgi:hypothetical protein